MDRGGRGRLTSGERGTENKEEAYWCTDFCAFFFFFPLFGKNGRDRFALACVGLIKLAGDSDDGPYLQQEVEQGIGLLLSGRRARAYQLLSWCAHIRPSHDGR